MSVSDPLLKNIKGYTLRFIEDLNNSKSIEDNNGNLLMFCQTIENIFYSGFSPTSSLFWFTKPKDPWMWLENISTCKDDIITFSYTSAITDVKRYQDVLNNTGKLRLLLRICLVHKMLHVPVKYLTKYNKTNKLYGENSILGNEILLEIFLSLLLQCSKLRFDLDLTNVSFLNETWVLPQLLKIELVPCTTLGITVSFAGDKAIIASIKRNSVVSENSNIEIGDILDKLNGVHICSSTKGKLNAVLKSAKGQPVTVQIIKSRTKESNTIYPPIIALLKKVQIDPASLLQNFDSKISSISDKKSSSAGFKAMYVGNVNVGKMGDAKQIDKAVRTLMSFSSNTDLNPNSQIKILRTEVYFEVGEIGVKVVDGNSEISLKHSYMEISSCGSISYMPHYFAYIAGDEYCDKANNFVCYVFYVKNHDLIYTILQSIGQGFQRTHFVV